MRIDIGRPADEGRRRSRWSAGRGGPGTATVRCSLARKLALHRPLIGHCALRTQTTLRAATAIECDIEKRKK